MKISERMTSNEDHWNFGGAFVIFGSVCEMYGPWKMTPRKKTPFSLHLKDQGGLSSSLLASIGGGKSGLLAWGPDCALLYQKCCDSGVMGRCTPVLLYYCTTVLRCHGQMYYRRMPSITLSVNDDGKRWPGRARQQSTLIAALISFSLFLWLLMFKLWEKKKTPAVRSALRQSVFIPWKYLEVSQMGQL